MLKNVSINCLNFEIFIKFNARPDVQVRYEEEDISSTTLKKIVSMIEESRIILFLLTIANEYLKMPAKLNNLTKRQSEFGL